MEVPFVALPTNVSTLDKIAVLDTSSIELDKNQHRLRVGWHLSNPIKKG